MSDESYPVPPIELLELATGYQRSKTLFTLVAFEVPTLLAHRSLPLSDIAAAIKLHPIAADRFLNACVALNLLERVGGEFRNTALSERFLMKGKPTYLGDQCCHYDKDSYPLWTTLASNLRSWHPGSAVHDIPDSTDEGNESMKAQHNLSLMVGRALGQAFDFSRHRTLLDLGGGTAAMSIGICQVNPLIGSIVVDLPGITEIAQTFVDSANLGSRISVLPGNFKEDVLPEGFDIALLANLLSVASEETNRRLFRSIYHLLPPGGVCIISGWILDDSRTSPLIPVLFCLEDIGWQAPDVERTESTYKRWLEEAGFTTVERSLYCPPTSMLVARK